MRVIVINTGTEILLGDVINTHLAYLARQFLPFGVRLERQLTIPDGTAIAVALGEAFAVADLVLVTGGLGPTTDDVTREIVASLLELPLQPDAGVMAAIEARARLRRFPVTDRMRRQALVPAGARVLPNHNGTAPGLYFPPGLKPDGSLPHLFLLPGPPRELYPMFEASALPLLREIIPVDPDFACRTLFLSGIGESLVEEAVGEELLATGEIELGYCARPGQVDVRLIGGRGPVAKAEKLIREKLGRHVFSAAEESLEQVVVALLQKRGETLALAESCTGGLLAHRVTNVPGASAVFLAGYVTYANEAKTDLCGVPAGLIEQQGAVSEEVARAMAEGARQRAGSTWALAITGIAGPGGGTAAKPVGTVFIALAAAGGSSVNGYNFAGDRESFKQLATQTALNLLWRALQP